MLIMKVRFVSMDDYQIPSILKACHSEVNFLDYVHYSLWCTGDIRLVGNELASRHHL